MQYNLCQSMQNETFHEVLRKIIRFRFGEGRVLGLFRFRVDTVIEDIVKVSFYCFSSILI